MGALAFGQTKNDCSWGSGGAVSPPEDPGQCLGEAWVQSPSKNFFFCIKHTKMVIVRVNIGQKISANILL